MTDREGEEGQLPGIEKRTLRTWVTAWIKHNPQHKNEDKDAYRGRAWDDVPHALLPPSESLLRRAFDSSFHKAAVAAGHRLFDRTDRKGRAVARYEKPIQLGFDDVFVEWLGRWQSAAQDRMSIVREIRAWLDAHEDDSHTLEAIIEALEDRTGTDL